MKKTYEYKQHLTRLGLSSPEWVVDGGYFWDGATYVAIVPAESDRLYYIPDTLIELTKEELVQRVLSIQHGSTTEQYCNASGNPLTDEELAVFVNQWWDDKVVG